MSRTSTRRILKALPITLDVASRADLQRSTAKQGQSKSIELLGSYAVFLRLDREVGALIEKVAAAK